MREPMPFAENYMCQKGGNGYLKKMQEGGTNGTDAGNERKNL